MMIALYSLKFVSMVNFLVIRQRFEMKYGELKRKDIDIFGNHHTEYYNDEDLKFSYKTYYYSKEQDTPMPLFISEYTADYSQNKFMVNDIIIDMAKKEGWIKDVESL